MKKIILLALIFLIPLIGNAETTTQFIKDCKMNGIDYQQTVSIIKNLQAAIKNQDIKTIAAVLDYPLRVNNPDNTSTKIKNANDFKKQYKIIFNQSLQNKILQADPNNVSCSWRGAMIANGTVWFTTEKNKIKIFAINRD